MERSKSLESIIDDADYTYVDPDAMRPNYPTMTLPRPRPPRPPPPRRPVSPNKPPIMQRTVAPPSPLEKKVMPLGPRNSAPSPPTPKQRTTNWYKDKKLTN